MQRVESFRVISDFPGSELWLNRIYDIESLEEIFGDRGVEDFDPRNYPLIFERIKEDRFNSDDMIDFAKFSSGNPSNDLLLKWMEIKDAKS